MNGRNRSLRLSRGQSLVLMGLNMLLLTILVCMTLSFGQKAKEKMELQMMADQAAYSTSVATARAFNQLAVMNRTIVAHNVVMLGVNSSISFGSLWFGILSWLVIDYALEIIHQLQNCRLPWGPYCGCWGFFAVLFGRFIPTILNGIRLSGMWPGLEQAAIQQANTAATNGFIQWTLQVLLHIDFYYNQLSGQATAGKAVAVPGVSEIKAPGGADTVTKKEIGIPMIPFTGAVNTTNLLLSDRHAISAAMGSRTHPWTAGRNNILPFSGAGPLLARWFRSTLGLGNDVGNRFLTDGTSYFSDLIHGNLLTQVNSTFAISDDHFIGIERYSGPGCRGWTLPLFSLSLLEANNGVGHHYASGFGIAISWPRAAIVVFDLPPIWTNFDELHTIPWAICLMNCPSAWSNFVDYDQRFLLGSFFGGGDADNWGQPKAPVAVQRDYSTRNASADPWDLGFKLRWNGRTTQMSMRNGGNYSSANLGIQLNPQTSGCSGANCDISKQTALSTGIAYYHRGGQHFKEPPNLFNPWWRAGLVHSDADRGAATGSDIPTTLSGAGAGWTVDSYNQLKAVGFRGWQ